MPRSFADWLTDHSPFVGYLREFRHAKWRVALAAMLGIIKHTPVLALPLYISYIIDRVIPRKDLEALGLCLVGMTALIVMNVAMHPLHIRLFSGARRDVAMRLRARLCHRIQQLTFAYHDRESSGRLHSKVMQDVEKLDRIGQVLIDPLLITMLTVVAATGIVLYTQPLFGLLLVVFVPVVYIQQKVFRRKLSEQFQSLRVEQEKLNAEVTEMLTMLPVTRAHATEAHDLGRISRRLESLRHHGVGADWFTHLLQSQIWGASQIVTIAVVSFGALLAIHGRMTIGEVVMFLSFVGMTIGGLSGIMTQLVAFYEGNEAIKSINEVMRFPQVEDNEGKAAMGPVMGEISFRGVWFAYPGNDRPVLKSLDLDIRPNQVIALVGGSGAGKSSFVKLLLGFYQPLKGEVRVDGQSLAEVDLRTFRRQIGIVTQETFLFKGTVRENLAHGLADVTEESLLFAAREANAYDFIMELPGGFDAEIGERGVRLSGGQKQRLAIARAMLRKPRLLLLDEATSALDSGSERLVQEGLERLMQGRTAFVIAHRLSTIQNADRILVFDDGRIVEDGSHDLLLKQGGVYAKLVELQRIA